MSLCCPLHEIRSLTSTRTTTLRIHLQIVYPGFAFVRWRISPSGYDCCRTQAVALPYQVSLTLSCIVLASTKLPRSLMVLLPLSKRLYSPCTPWRVSSGLSLGPVKKHEQEEQQGEKGGSSSQVLRNDLRETSSSVFKRR